MKIYIEIIQLVVGGLAIGGFLYLINNIHNTYQKKQDRKKDLRHVIQSLKNSEKIYDNLVKISQDFRASYGHILLISNGGKKMNEITDKRLTIRAEFVGSKDVPQLKHIWKSREIDGEWLKMINIILEDGYIHIKNVDKRFPDRHRGLRKLYNPNLGNELFMGKIDWVGDTLVLFSLQPGIDNMTPRQLGELLGRSQDFASLFSNAKYFIEK